METEAVYQKKNNKTKGEERRNKIAPLANNLYLQ